MTLTLHNEILNRMKRTWELLRPSATPVRQSGRRIDHLVKQNLPPLMGRRDAAYDQATDLLESDLFSRDETGRRQLYGRLCELFDRAVEDTEAILITLASPDTETREKRQLSFFILLRSISIVLDDLSGLEKELFSGENPTLTDLAIHQSEEATLRGEKMLSEAEINVVNQLRFYCESARPKMERYREYTSKSFSKLYASRYQKAYEAYQRIYREEIHMMPPAVRG